MEISTNLANLKSNPELVASILSSLPKKGKSKKEIKVIKARISDRPVEKAAVSKPTSIVVMVEDEEKPEIKKAHKDDDSYARINSIHILLKNIENYYSQRTPSYEAMATLCASAYRYAVTPKLRLEIAKLRDCVKKAIENNQNKERKQARLKKKSLDKSEMRTALKEFSNKVVNIHIEQSFGIIRDLLNKEVEKQEGRAYDNTHKDYHVDLTKYEAQLDAVVLARADLMVTAAAPVDKNAKFNNFDILHIEGPIYCIKNALIVGFRPAALPKKLTEETLEISMAQTFNLKAVPVPKQLRHNTSNRIWFFVPETTEITTKTIAFADRSLNSEFDVFKTLSNDPTEDDVRFIFIKAGVDEKSISEIINRWAKNDSRRGRMALLINEYRTVERKLKNERLKKAREDFDNQNKELITQIEKNKDRLIQIDEEKIEIVAEFSTLASHTGRADQGLPISKHSLLGSVFDRIETVAVKGNPDSYARRMVRKGIQADKMKCRRLYYVHRDLTTEAKIARDSIKMKESNLKHLKGIAFRSFAGFEEELEDEV